MAGILDFLSQTWPARLAQDVWSGVTAPRDAWQGRLDPLSAEGIGRINSLAMLPMMGTFAGAPAGALGSGPVSPFTAHALELENFITQWARGEMSAKSVQSEFQKRGWTTDLRRGRYDVEAFDPSGKSHYLTP